MFKPEQGGSSRENKAENHDEETKASLKAFIRNNGMNVQQVEDAYFICIDRDATSVDEAVPDERVFSLAKLFSDAEREGFALNGIGGIVSEMERRVSAPGKLLAFINDLPVDDRSRRSLISIFEQNRTGEIRFVDPKTLQYIVSQCMRLPDTFKELSVEERAEQLLDVLSLFVKKIGDRSFGIEFSDGN